MGYRRFFTALCKRLLPAFVVLLTVFLLASAPVEASVTSQITYQAKLFTSSGAPVADGTYSVKFSLYTAESGGTPIWTAAGVVGAPTAVTVTSTNGAFSVGLGDVSEGHNSLADVDWDRSALYLGITVSADAEMTPRRRLTAVPQAFLADNALRLQGMYASSTAYGGQSLFTIHQTETSAATGTRTALEVRSEGTSTANDYLFRGINDLGATVFSLARDGSVTSTNLTASNTVSSSQAIVSGLFTGRHATISGLVSSTFLGFSSLTSVTDYATSLTSPLEESMIVGNRLFIPRASTIEIFDVADPKVERYLGTLTISGTIGSYAVRGGLLYLYYRDTGDGTNRFSIYDVKDPTTPTLLGRLDTIGANVTLTDVAIYNQVAYVASGNGSRLFVIDITKPTAPFLTNEVFPSGAPVRLYIDGRTLYMTRNQGGSPGRFLAFDIEDPTLPVQRVSLATGAAPQTIERVGSTLYIFNQTGQSITIINIQNPTVPVIAQTFSLGYGPKSAVTFGERLVIGGDDGLLHLYNVASSTAPVSVGSYTIDASADIVGLAAQGQSLFAVTDASPYVHVYLVPGITVDALNGGRGTFHSLDVQKGIKIAENADIAGSLVIGQGGILSQGGVIANATSTEAVAGSFVNLASSTLSDRSWGLYTNRFLAGENTTATGSKNYVALFAHNSGQSRFGVCIDNTNTASTCLDFASTSTVYSLLADEAIGANAFDLAERYAISGEAAPGDLLILDPDQPLHMRKSPGIPYDSHVSGVVSTRPGFLLGSGGNASVALVGRVPLNVTVSNGAIRPGDPLTSSDRPGVAMKATQAGVIVGRALEAATSDGVVEVYVQPGFDASSWLQADGSMTLIAQDTGLQAQQAATADAPLQASKTLSFRGSAWDGARPVVSEFRLFNNTESPSQAALQVQFGTSSSSLFSLSQNGSLTLAGDLALAGRLYPSARGRAQHESYLFVDDSVPGAPYISTNADGWQSQSGYDYAERYQSPDKLEPGDLVVVNRSQRLYVQRSLDNEHLPIGIVSTKPGFIAGRPQADSYPIALTGRVPTKVSTINGAIEAGDVLAPSTIPGVAVKATHAGPMIGLALEGYAGADVGKIEVFVNPSWWGGVSTGETVLASAKQKTAQGFAEIAVGRTRVHVELTDFIRYPHLQITPYSQLEQGWWLDRVTSEGFDLVMGGVIGHSARFAWTAAETPDETKIALSSGRTFTIDPFSGRINMPPEASDQDPPPEPAPETVQIAPIEESAQGDEMPTSTEGTLPVELPSGGTSTTAPEVSIDPVPSEPTAPEPESVPTTPDILEGA